MYLKYTALPTWLLTLLMVNWLPKTHPWYKRKFTLEEWARGRTTDCKLIDFNLWIGVFLAIELVTYIFRH